MQEREFSSEALEQALVRLRQEAENAETEQDRQRYMQAGRRVAAQLQQARAFGTEIDVSAGGASAAARMELAGVDTPEEREAVIRLHYPEGQYFGPSATTDQRETFRPSPTEPLQYIDPTVSELAARPIDQTRGALGQLAQANARGARIVGEGLLETFDVLGADAPAVTAEGLLLAGLSRSPAGRGAMIARPIATGALIGMAGGAGGGAFEQGLQYVRGTQRQTPIEQLRTVSLETSLGGAGGAIGGSLGTAGARTESAIRERGALNITDEGLQAQRSFEELAQGRRSRVGQGQLGLMASQLSDSEFIQALTSAASKIFPRLGRYQEEQRQVLLDSINSLRSADNVERARNNVLAQYEGLMGSYRADLRNALGQSGISPRQGGEAIAAGRQLFERESGQAVNALYESAAEIAGDSVIFNIREGDNSLVQKANATFEDFSRRVRQRPRQEGGEVSTASTLPPSERANAEAVLSLIEELPDDANIEELRRLASTLYDQSQPGPEGMRASNVLASRLRSDILDTLANPISDSADVVEAYRIASEAARQRFSALELSDVVGVANQASGRQFYQIYSSLTQPSAQGVDRLTNVREALTSQPGGRQKWAEFRESFRTDLISDIGALPQRLAEYDSTEGRAMLEQLMPASQLNQLQEIAARVERLQSTNIERVAQQEEIGRNFATRLLQSAGRDSSSTEAMREFLEASGGANWRESPAGRSIRAGIIEEFARRTVQSRARGTEAISPRAVEQQLSRFRQSGLLQFLTDSDLRTLENVENVASFVEALGADVGTSLVARQEVNNLFNNTNVLKTIGSLAPYMTFGRLMTNEGVQRALRGEAASAPQQSYVAQRFAISLIDDIIADEQGEAEYNEQLGNIANSVRDFGMEAL